MFPAAPSNFLGKIPVSRVQTLTSAILYAAGDPRTYLGQKPLSPKHSLRQRFRNETHLFWREAFPKRYRPRFPPKKKDFSRKVIMHVGHLEGLDMVLHANGIQKHLETNPNPCTSCLPMTTASANGTELKTPRRWKRCELHWAGLEPNVKTAHLFTLICKQKAFTFWLSTPRPFLLKLRSLTFFNQKQF